MSEVYGFIKAEMATHHAALLCRLLKVAPWSFCAWLAGEKARSARKAGDDPLACEIAVVYLAGRRGGSPDPCRAALAGTLREPQTGRVRDA